MASNLPKRPDILAQWSRASIPTEWSATPPERRSRLVSAIALAMDHTPAARSIAHAKYWTLAAAAGVAALVGLGTVGSYLRESSEPAAGRLVALFGPDATIVHGRSATSAGSVSGSVPVAFDSRVDTARDSSSRLELASGVVIAVGSDTHLSLPHAKDRASPREELGLEGGAVRVDVPKLGAGHVFAIRTPDTWITVHGTSFSVEVSGSPWGPVSTNVGVTEGVVTVQQAGEPEVFLTAGMRWVSTGRVASASSAPAAASPEASGGSVPGVDVKAAPAPVLGVAATMPAAGSLRRPAPSALQTALAEQNRLFSEAMTACERGDGAGAAQMLESFIRRYPASPLTEDAHVELFRGLAQMRDRAGAARAARRYLALYGDGFARDEARELALEPGAPPQSAPPQP